MLEVIEKLLILQNRDQQIERTREEIAHIGPEMEAARRKTSGADSILEAARHRMKKLESERKEMELQVEAKKEQIIKYSQQQFQTKKNEEYKALSNEIETCKKAISDIEDRELEVMEQQDQAAAELAAAQKGAQEAKGDANKALELLEKRQTNMQEELTRLESDRGTLASEVDDTVLNRYERLVKQKGARVVMGIEHSCCGGCHVRLPTQVVMQCRGSRELTTCPTCGRILYYTGDMALEADLP